MVLFNALWAVGHSIVPRFMLRLAIGMRRGGSWAVDHDLLLKAMSAQHGPRLAAIAGLASAAVTASGHQLLQSDSAAEAGKNTAPAHSSPHLGSIPRLAFIPVMDSPVCCLGVDCYEQMLCLWWTQLHYQTGGPHHSCSLQTHPCPHLLAAGSLRQAFQENDSNSASGSFPQTLAAGTQQMKLDLAK